MGVSPHLLRSVIFSSNGLLVPFLVNVRVCTCAEVESMNLLDLFLILGSCEAFGTFDANINSGFFFFN